jgi:hypothetical protein
MTSHSQGMETVVALAFAMGRTLVLVSPLVDE